MTFGDILHLMTFYIWWHLTVDDIWHEDLWPSWPWWHVSFGYWYQNGWNVLWTGLPSCSRRYMLNMMLRWGLKLPRLGPGVPEDQVYAVWEGCRYGLWPHARLCGWGACWDHLDDCPFATVLNIFSKTYRVMVCQFVALSQLQRLALWRCICLF